MNSDEIKKVLISGVQEKDLQKMLSFSAEMKNYHYKGERSGVENGKFYIRTSKISQSEAAEILNEQSLRSKSKI